MFSYPSQLARGGDGELSPMGVCAALDVVHGVVRSYSDDASGMGAAVDLLLEQVRRWSKQRVIRSYPQRQLHDPTLDVLYVYVQDGLLADVCQLLRPVHLHRISSWPSTLWGGLAGVARLVTVATKLLALPLDSSLSRAGASGRGRPSTAASEAGAGRGGGSGTAASSYQAAMLRVAQETGLVRGRWCALTLSCARVDLPRLWFPPCQVGLLVDALGIIASLAPSGSDQNHGADVGIPSLHGGGSIANVPDCATGVVVLLSRLLSCDNKAPKVAFVAAGGVDVLKVRHHAVATHHHTLIPSHRLRACDTELRTIASPRCFHRHAVRVRACAQPACQGVARVLPSPRLCWCATGAAIVAVPYLRHYSGQGTALAALYVLTHHSPPALRLHLCLPCVVTRSGVPPRWKPVSPQLLLLQCAVATPSSPHRGQPTAVAPTLAFVASTSTRKWPCCNTGAWQRRPPRLVVPRHFCV